MNLIRRAVFIVLSLVLTATAALSQSAPVFRSLPLAFEPNRGQADPAYSYFARGPRYDVGISPEQTVIRLGKQGSRLVLHPLGATGVSTLHADQPLPGVSNYYSGNDPSRWLAGVPQFGRLLTNNLYDGVDLVQYGTEGELEWDFVVRPGADPRNIAFAATGAEKIAATQAGDLEVTLRGETLTLRHPVAYQVAADGRRLDVPARYSHSADGRIHFELAAYDRMRTLVIDPVLNFSSVLTAAMNPLGMRLDSAGNMYLVGDNITLYKISPAGALLFQTTLMSADARDMALDASGNTYVVGNTNSTTFPTTPGAYQTTCPSFCNTPVAVKLNSSGAVVYSTYLGPSNGNALGLSVAGDGSLLIGGIVASVDLPLVNAIDSTPPQLCTECSKGSLQRLSNDGSSLLFSTYFKATIARVNAIDPNFYAIGQDLSVWKITEDGQTILAENHYGNPGSAEIVASALGLNGGLILSGNIASADFPFTQNAARAACFNPSDCGYPTVFLVRIDSSGSLNYASAVIEGRVGPGMFVDHSGNVYLTGGTNMPQSTVNGIQSVLDDTPDATTDAFVVELSPSGNTLFSTFFGGGNVIEVGNSVAVDASGNIDVFGGATQNGNDQVDYPTLHSVQTLSSCCFVNNSFVAQIGTSGRALLLATKELASGNSYKVRNLGSVSVSITSVTSNSSFVIASSDCVGTLPGGGICDIALRNTAVFTAFATITVNNSASAFSFSDSVSPGAPAAMLHASPHFKVYPPVMVGSSGPAFNVKVLNISPTPAGSLNIFLVNNTDFHQTNNCPLTLNAVTPCQVTVTFTPTTPGLLSDQMPVNTSGQSDNLYLAEVASATAFSPSVSLLNFGTQLTDATLPPRAFELYNATPSTIGITGASGTPPFSAAVLNCTSVPAWGSCRGTASFAPTQNGFYSGTLTFTHNGPGGAVTIPAYGTGRIDSGLSLSSYDLNFGATLVNHSFPQTVTLTNVGTAPISISNVTAPSQFATSDDCPDPIPAAASCTLTVTYQPTTPETDDGEVLIYHTATGSPQNINITASARTALAFSPTSLDFGQVMVGATSDAVWVSLGNNGPTATITQIAVDPEFSIDSNSCGSTIPAFTACAIYLRFTPAAAGTRSGSLSVTASDYNRPHVLPLSGIGVAPPAITVLAPNGGESWAAGSNHTIGWNYTSLSGNVTITLLKAGAAYKTVATVPLGASGSGSYLWTLPANLPTASDYTIRVASISSPTVVDTSNANFSVSAPAASTITVVTPAGGESWAGGSAHTIQWNYTGLTGNVSIALLKSGVGYLSLGTVPVGSAGSGSFLWTLPITLPISSDYRIRISSTSVNVSAYSNGLFAVSPWIQVTSPNGGESWTAGTQHTIQWSYSGISSNVNIALLKGGSGYLSIATNVPVGSGGNGSFSWTLPSNLPSGHDYTVRVSTASGTSYVDVSDAAFPIYPPKVTVTSPNGGDSWAAGSTHPIYWQYDGAPGNLNIALLKAGSAYLTIASGVSPGSGGLGAFNWTLPMTLPIGGDYTIRLSSATLPAVGDASDAPFSVTPSIQVTSPNGGESWLAGSPHAIAWKYDGIAGTINIALLKAGAGYLTIASGVAVGSNGSGSLNWTPPLTLPAGSDYSVRVSTVATPTIVDVSDAPFSIIKPGITVTAPNGGETWSRGTTKTIKWSYAGSVGTAVRVQLYKSGVLNRTITTSTSIGSNGSGQFNWAIPASQTTGTGFTIKVTSTTVSTATDSSNASFTIQ